MIPIILSLEKHGVDIIHDSLCKKLRKNDERVLSVHSKQQRELSKKNGWQHEGVSCFLWLKIV
jgi:hypothetical protein